MNKPPRREIKSYIRRESRMSPALREALVRLWPKYGLSITDGLLAYQQVFHQPQKLILEIGFGMGQSLLQMAKATQDTCFIAVEVHRPGIANLLVGLEKEQLNNVRVYCEDAILVLKQAIPDHSLNRTQVFFPDPWPKRRHHKRRLIQPSFLELLHQKLVPGGIFHAATDWQDYAVHIFQTLETSIKFTNVAQQKFATKPAYRPLTKFEERGYRLGHQSWDIIFKVK